MIIVASLDYREIWEFDAATSAGRDTTSEAPKHAVEAGALIQQHVVDSGDSLDGSGTITFTPAIGETGQARADGYVEKLRAMQAAHLPVWWLGPSYAGQALLTGVKCTATAADGYAYKVEVKAVRLQTVTPQLTTMPASRLKASVKPGSAAGASGQANQRRSTFHKVAYKK